MKTFYKIIIAIFVLFSVICFNTPESTPNVPVETINEVPNTDVCYWDWDFTATHYIGKYSEAPSGYVYAIAEVYIKNDASRSISTNAWNWCLIADGIQYQHDSNTYSDSINHVTVDIGRGGEMTTKMVFLIPESVTSASLMYNSYGGPEMVRIVHFK